MIQTHWCHVSCLHSQDEESWVKELKKLLSNESFYFCTPGSGRDEESPPVDLTLCAQRRAKTNVSDNRFFWWVQPLVYISKGRQSILKGLRYAVCLDIKEAAIFSRACILVNFNNLILELWQQCNGQVKLKLCLVNNIFLLLHIF